MCGACGSATVPDPALGPVRTMRQHVIVAHAINAVCRRLPGAPRVTALLDGWLMSGATGATQLCHTVEELWTAIIGGSFTTNAHLTRLIEEQNTYSADPANTGLGAQVTDLGRALAEEHRQGTITARSTGSFCFPVRSIRQVVVHRPDFAAGRPSS